jgi:hypothetical protein
MAATPGVFFYFADANPYTIVILAVILSLMALDRALAHNRIFDWFLYFLTLAFGLAVHNLFIFYASAQWLIPCIRFFRKSVIAQNPEQQKSGLSATAIFRFGVVLLITLALWLVWLVFYSQSGGYQRPPVLRRLASLNTLFCLIGMIPGPLTYGHWVQWISFPILLIAGMFRVWRSYREKLLEWALLWILPVVMITIFVQLTSKFLGYRYGLGVFPITCLIAVLGAGMNRASPDLRTIPRFAKGSLLLRFVFLAYLLAGFGRLALGGRDLFTYQEWKQAESYLRLTAASQDYVWIPGESLSYPLRFYESSRKALNIVWPAKGGKELAVADLRSMAQSAKISRRGVWIVCPGFANSIPWINKNTRIVAESPEAAYTEIISALPEQTGYHLVPVQEYKRIRIFRLDERH